MSAFGGESAAGPKKIIISGAPASGKGTQCEFLVQKFGVVHISTGDALREQVVKAGTDLGKKAKGFMDSGGLVPDEVMIGIVNARLAEKDCVEKGWLLDGFPRTAAQAEAIKKGGHTADKFIILNVPDNILIERCVGRRTDPVTGKIYHTKFNP
ncbi:adenylate kinase-domain-containing protein, partial [Baffinella frigidus]